MTIQRPKTCDFLKPSLWGPAKSIALWNNQRFKISTLYANKWRFSLSQYAPRVRTIKNLNLYNKSTLHGPPGIPFIVCTDDTCAGEDQMKLLCKKCLQTIIDDNFTNHISKNLLPTIHDLIDQMDPKSKRENYIEQRF